MLRLSNGHSFEYLAASGALGYDGLGWPWEQPLRLPGLMHPEMSIFEPRLFTAVTKTITPQPVTGNLRWSKPWDCVALIPHGVVNAVGLTNPGLGWWRMKVGPTLEKAGTKVIVSITADDPFQLGQMAAVLDDFPIVGLELNASCPNSPKEKMADPDFVVACCEAIKAKTVLPLILKLSVRHPIPTIVHRVPGLVEALSVNSVPWADIFPDTPSPLAKFGGGAVSGGAAQGLTWGLVRQLRREASIPIIGPSVWWFHDLNSLRALGCSALSFGSIWLRYPWKPTLYVKNDRAMIQRHSLAKSFCLPAFR